MQHHELKHLVALEDVIAARAAQRFEFGEREDDTLQPAEWVARIAKHLGRAVSQDPDAYRQQLVVVGALALAAIESFDRRGGESYGSH